MRRVLLLFLFIPGVIFAKSDISGSIEYHVSMPNPHNHYFEVEIEFKNIKGDVVDFKMPVWTPGSYLVREYPKNVNNFKVRDGAGITDIPFQKINKNTWRVEAKGKNTLTLIYSVYANEGMVRMSYLDDSHAFIMANTLLMYVDELRDQSAILHLDIPKQWSKVSTSLSALDGQKHSYYVPNYDILVDSPIEIGNHDIIEFKAAGVPHEIAMYGKANYDSERLKRDITKIVEESTKIFDDNPNEKYVFIVHNTSKRGGGLEHLSSTVLGVQRNAYNDERSYNGFLSLVAHEYFHLWLVKRIRPIELERLNYDEEMYTDQLWIMEGLTSYFEEKVMLRCGFYDKNMFLNSLVRNMAYHQNLPGSKVQSLSESSFDAWIKHYRKNENTSNTQVSYYSKGMLIGALLDLEIIKGSEGKKSLDDVINHLYYHYYKKKDKGITHQDFKKSAEKFSGIQLDNFFQGYVYGTETLDNEKFLGYAGIGLIETNEKVNARSIGVNVSDDGGILTIKSIVAGSAAYDGGLNVGDELIAIAGYRINERNLKSIINQFKIDEKVIVMYSRDGLIEEREIEIRKDRSVVYTYELLENPTKQQKAVFNSWLDK